MTRFCTPKSYDMCPHVQPPLEHGHGIGHLVIVTKQGVGRAKRAQLLVIFL